MCAGFACSSRDDHEASGVMMELLLGQRSCSLAREAIERRQRRRMSEGERSWQQLLDVTQ